MHSRRLHLALIAAAVIALAACTSSGSGKGKPSASAGRVSADAARLGTLLTVGIKSIRTAHVQLAISLAGQSITGQGEENVDAGKLGDSRITVSVPSFGDIEIVIVGSTTYAKLPSSANTSGKPWVLVSSHSSDPVVTQLASAVDSAKAAASLDSVRAFVGAADSVTSRGSQRINGVATTHYSIKVDPAKLPAGFPGKDALVAAAPKSLPVELNIDSSGRPVQVTEDITAAGQAVSTKLVLSKYNQPVSISAPPADQVSTK